MTNSVLNIKPYPDFEKEVISFNKKGEKITKKVTSTNNYLVTVSNGNSFVADEKQLKELGINPNKVGQVVTQSEEDDDDLIQTEEKDTTVVENPSNLSDNSPLIFD